jgi:hypothetical protein
LRVEQIWQMNLIEYFNAATILIKRKKDLSEKLNEAARMAKADKSNERYIIAMLKEIVHLMT